MVGAEDRVLTLLYRIVGEGCAAKVTFEQRLEGRKQASCSGVSKCKGLDAEACLAFKEQQRLVWLEKVRMREVRDKDRSGGSRSWETRML